MTQTPSAFRIGIVAGHPFELLRGVRYYASRPFAERGRTDYEVTIRRVDDGAFAWVVAPLTYDEANTLINAFNDEPGNSWAGRVW